MSFAVTGAWPTYTRSMNTPVSGTSLSKISVAVVGAGSAVGVGADGSVGGLTTGAFGVDEGSTVGVGVDGGGNVGTVMGCTGLTGGAFTSGRMTMKSPMPAAIS